MRVGGKASGVCAVMLTGSVESDAEINSADALFMRIEKQ